MYLCDGRQEGDDLYRELYGGHGRRVRVREKRDGQRGTSALGYAVRHDQGPRQEPHARNPTGFGYWSDAVRERRYPRCPQPNPCRISRYACSLSTQFSPGRPGPPGIGRGWRRPPSPLFALFISKNLIIQESRQAGNAPPNIQTEAIPKPPSSCASPYATLISIFAFGGASRPPGGAEASLLPAQSSIDTPPAPTTNIARTPTQPPPAGMAHRVGNDDVGVAAKRARICRSTWP